MGLTLLKWCQTFLYFVWQMTRYKQHKIPITVYKKRKTVLNHREIHSTPHIYPLTASKRSFTSAWTARTATTTTRRASPRASFSARRCCCSPRALVRVRLPRWYATRCAPWPCGSSRWRTRSRRCARSPRCATLSATTSSMAIWWKSMTAWRGTLSCSAMSTGWEGARHLPGERGRGWVLTISFSYDIVNFSWSNEKKKKKKKIVSFSLCLQWI